jgi:nitrate/nitrite-specific signal transduction histidine kinase
MISAGLIRPGHSFSELASPADCVSSPVNPRKSSDFSARALEERHDELGQLAHGFNFMAASLAESYASLELKVEEASPPSQPESLRTTLV